MARNESVGTMVTFLCFGTAILSLAVHWHTTRTTGQLNQSTFTKVYPHGSAVEIGNSAIAASVPNSPQKSAVINLDFSGKPASQFWLMLQVRSIIPSDQYQH